GRTGESLAPAPGKSPRASRGLEGIEPGYCFAGRPSTLAAQCRDRPTRRRRRLIAQTAAARLQHRNRRWSRSVEGKDRARRSDGRNLEARERADIPRRVEEMPSQLVRAWRVPWRK